MSCYQSKKISGCIVKCKVDLAHVDIISKMAFRQAVEHLQITVRKLKIGLKLSLTLMALNEARAVPLAAGAAESDTGPILARSVRVGGTNQGRCAENFFVFVVNFVNAIALTTKILY